MDIKASDFDPKFLKTAQRVIKDGEVSQKDLSELIEAAGGKLSDAEKALIANLDDQQVQGALKQAAEGKDGVFKKYAFEQVVEFHLDENKKLLEVDHRQVNVDEAIRQADPQKKFRLAFARDADKVRADLNEGGGLQMGIRQIKQGTSQDATAINQMIERAQGDRGVTVSVESVEEFKVGEGLNLTYSLLVAKAGQAARDPASSSKQEIQDFNDLLKQLQRGKEPSDGKRLLLRKFGLEYKDGKLFNPVSKEALSASQLESLAQTAHAANQAFQGMGVFAENKIARQVFGQFNISPTVLADLETARDEYLAAEVEVRQDQAQVEQSIQDVDAQTAEVQRQEQDMREQTALYEELGGLLNNGKFDPALIEARLSRLNPKQLAQINQLLKAHGFEIKIEGGRARFLKNGNPLPNTEFFAQMGPLVGALRKDLGQRQAQLVQARAELESRKQKLEQDKQKLTQSKARFEQAGTHYDAAKTEAEKAKVQLQARLNDPNERAKLSPEELAAGEALLGQLNTGLSNYDADLARRQPLLDSVDQTLSKADRALNNAIAALKSLDQFLADFGGLFNQLNKALDQLQAHQQQIAELSEALCKRANELEAQLNLMPKPMYVGMETLAEELRALMEETRNGFEQLGRQQHSHDGFETRLSREYLQKVQDQLKHHLEQLGSMDQHGKELMARFLTDSLKFYQTMLQAS
ncbi:MAG TPA: hypothetical protein V6D23_21880 [Candidatus Obscuribacterales bacterium]